MTSSATKSSFWHWYLDASGVETRADIVRWWERRRLAFNLGIGAVGIFTWLAVLTAGSASVKLGVDFEEPFAMILGPPFYALMANICFTAGWIFDEIFYKGSPRRRLLQVGFWFSIGLTSLPGLWAIFCWVRAVKTGRLLD
jgi:hypothetical protein